MLSVLDLFSDNRTTWSAEGITEALQVSLPTGYRYIDGSFFNQSDYAVFWSSTENGGSNAWFRYLFYSNTDVTQDYTNKPNGFSVRCVQD